MTAHALKGDRERCLESGMDRYITKPVRAGQLFDTLAELFPAADSADRGAAAASTPVAIRPVEPAAPAAEQASRPHVIDWDGALKVVQQDPAVLKAVVEAAVEEIPRLVQAIRQAIDAGDAPRVRLYAHTLKASLCPFIAGKTVEHAFRLECMGRDGCLENAHAVLAILQDETAVVTAELNAYLRGEKGTT